MTLDWETWKPEICFLYLDRNLTLREVSKYMWEKHRFRASIRRYNDKFSEWGCQKRNRSRFSQLSTSTADSVYASGSASDSWSISPSLRASALSFGSYASGASASSSISGAITPTVMDGSNFIGYDRFSDLNRPLPPPDAVFPLRTFPTSPAFGITVDCTPRSAVAHPRSSRCPRATTAHSATLTDYGPCTDCGAGNLHSFMAVASFFEVKIFEMVVRKEARSLNDRDIFGNTCLHSAASSWLRPDHFEILRMLGADFSARNNDGQLFLHLLPPADDLESFREMLNWVSKQKIDLTTRSFEGDTILHVLLRNQIGWSTLHQVCGLLSDAGDGVNYRNKYGVTPIDCLKMAWRRSEYSEYCDRGAIERLDSLLKTELSDYIPEQGAFWLSTQRHSPSPHSKILELLPWLSDSETRSDTEMLKLVEASDWDPKIQDHRGRNGLHCLAQILRYPEYRGQVQPPLARIERMMKCIEQGVDVNLYDGDGSTPFHSILGELRSNDNDECLARIVHKFLEKGADPELRDKYGNTALHLACRNGRPACVRVLLQYILHRRNGMEMHTIRSRNEAGRSIIAETLAYVDAANPPENHLRLLCIQSIYETGLWDERAV